MEELPVQPFDDPALKAALRRCLGKESAPAGLRERIAALSSAPTQPTMKLATDSKPAADAKPIPMFRKSPLYRFAVAAVLLIGFGSLGYQIWKMTHQNPYIPSYIISDAAYQNMVDHHEDHKTGKTTDHITTLAAAPGLGKQFGEMKKGIFVPDLTKDGWTFKGASVQKVENGTGVQLFFTKGNEALSVYSLPASTVAPKSIDKQDYEKMFNGMPIAGFTDSGGLYCIVGDKSVDLTEVKRLLNEHKGEIAKG